MADDDVFQEDRGRGGGGAASGEQAIPRWQSDSPPGLMQYLEQQRMRMGQQGVDPGLGFREQRRMGQQDVAPGPIPAVNQMEQALGVMESRMGPVLDDACKRPGGTGCLRNAKRALCTFHIFNRDYNADLSGYGQEEWFRIFRDNLWGLQGSETHAEKDARYEYILNCLNTWDCLGIIFF